MAPGVVVVGTLFAALLATAAASAAAAPPTITAPWCFIEATGAMTPTASKCVASTATDASGRRIAAVESIQASLPIGLHKVTVRADDSSGNWASTTRVILVNDTAAPTITVPGKFTKVATGAETPVAESEYGSPLGSDAVSPPATASCDVPNELPAAPPRSFACTATDARGNAASKTFIIEITDGIAPVFDSTVPVKITAEARGPYTKLRAEDLRVTATDNADDDVTITPSVMYMGVEERRTVTWTARDNVGNTATIRQEVTMKDKTAPSVFAPPDVTIKSAGPVSASSVSLGSPIVFDWGDPVPKVKNNAPSQFPVGTTTVRWTAEDTWDNIGSDTQEVVVGASATPSSSRILWTYVDVQYVGVVGVADVAVLPDDMVVVPGWYDQEIFVLDSTDGSLVRRIVDSRAGYGMSVAALAESATDKRFAVADQVRTVHVYDDHEDTAPTTLGSLQAPSTAHRRGVILDSLGDKLAVYQNDRVSVYSASDWDRPLHTTAGLDSLYTLPDSMEASEHGASERVYVGPIPWGDTKSIYVYDGASGNKVDTVTMPNTRSWMLWPRVAVSDDGRSLFIEHSVSSGPKSWTGTIRHYDTVTKTTTVISEPGCCDTYGNPFEYADGKLYVPRHSSTHMEFAVYNVAIDAETNAPGNALLGTVSIPRTQLDGSGLYMYPRYMLRHLDASTFLTEEYVTFGDRVVRLIHAVDLGSPTPPSSAPGQSSPAGPAPAQLRLVEPSLVSTEYVGADTIELTYDTELDPYMEYAAHYRLSEGWHVSDLRVDGSVITLTYAGAGAGSGDRPSIAGYADVRHPVYATGSAPSHGGAAVPPPPPPPPPPQRDAPGEQAP